MAKLKPCPFCGGTKSVEIEAVGGEWVGLIIRGRGSVYPEVCLNCGIVYIPKDEVERIRRAEDGK